MTQLGSASGLGGLLSVTVAFFLTHQIEKVVDSTGPRALSPVRLCLAGHVDLPVGSRGRMVLAHIWTV
jgi:hypothetical protein